MYKLPERGGEGGGNSDNARKKTFFFFRRCSLRLSLVCNGPWTNISRENYFQTMQLLLLPLFCLLSGSQMQVKAQYQVRSIFSLFKANDQKVGGLFILLALYGLIKVAEVGAGVYSFSADVSGNE